MLKLPLFLSIYMYNDCFFDAYQFRSSLVDTDIPVVLTSQKGMTYAHIAASKGSVGVIKELMRFNKSVICTAKNSVSLYTYNMATNL